MAMKWTNTGIEKVKNGTVDLQLDDIQGALLGAGYTFSMTHDFMSDVTDELSGGGYARSPLAAITIVKDDANDGANINCLNVRFNSLGAAAGQTTQLAIFVNVGSDPTNILLAVLDLPPTTGDGNDLVVNFLNGKIGHWRNAAGQGVVYNEAITQILNGAMDLLGDPLLHGMYEAGYSANPDHSTNADLSDSLAGGNYSEQSAAGQSISPDDPNNGAFFTVNDPVYTSLQAAAGSPTQMVTRRTSPDTLVCQSPFIAPDIPDGNNYVVRVDAAGLLTVRNSAA